MAKIVAKLLSNHVSFSAYSSEFLTAYLWPTLSRPDKCAIITFGALKPLLNRILVPSAGVGGAGGGMSEADLEPEEAEAEVEVQEGESIEDIKAKLKPKKTAISAEMLDTANTYDDKVAVIRMIVGDEAGKVSNVFRQLMKKDA